MQAQIWPEIPVAVCNHSSKQEATWMLNCRDILVQWLANVRGCCGGLCTPCNEKVHSYQSHPESLTVELRELLHQHFN